MKKISIVIVNWNGKDMLKDCLDSIYKQSFKNYDVIVSDNGSTDGSVEFLKKNFPKIKIIENKKNLGFAEGNNLAIREAQGEYIFTLNNDTRLEKDCLKELIKAMEADSQIGMVASKLILMKNNKIDTLGHLLYKSFLPWDCKSETETGKVISVCAGAALYRRKALESIKIKNDYFDSDFYLYVEDLDLGLRMRLQGWKYAYAQKAIVHHLHSATAKKIPDRVIFYTHRNIIWTIAKNIPSTVILKNLGFFLMGQFGTLMKYSIIGRPGLIISSKFSALKGLPKMLMKRREIMKRKKISDSEFNKLLYTRIM